MFMVFKIRNTVAGRKMSGKSYRIPIVTKCTVSCSYKATICSMNFAFSALKLNGFW